MPPPNDNISVSMFAVLFPVLSLPFGLSADSVASKYILPLEQDEVDLMGSVLLHLLLASTKRPLSFMALHKRKSHHQCLLQVLELSSVLYAARHTCKNTNLRTIC